MARKDEPRAADTVSQADRLTPTEKVKRLKVLYEEAVTGKTTGVYDSDKPPEVIAREQQARQLAEMQSLRDRILLFTSSESNETGFSIDLSDSDILRYIELRRRCIVTEIEKTHFLVELLTEEGIALDSFVSYPSKRIDLAKERLVRLEEKLNRLKILDRIHPLDEEQTLKYRYLEQEHSIWMFIAQRAGALDQPAN